MELRHLRYFLAVAEELHFARAGARLGIEQSPLSRQIRDLEADLRVRLFDRTSRSTRLTAAGARLKTHARRILDDIEISMADVQSFASSKTAPLRLGLAETAAGASFGRFMRLAAAAEPPLPVVLRERPAVELVDLLSGGALDAILTYSPPPAGDFVGEPVWSEPLMLVRKADGGHAPELTSLRDHAAAWWILPDPVSFPGAAAQIAALLTRYGIAPREPLLAGSPHSAIRLAATGAGVALAPCSGVEVPDPVLMHPLAEADAVLTTWMTVRREVASPVANRAMALARTAAEDQALEDQAP